ncbi:hypothetical protein HPB50_017399 [Hyalomma asiaticum]|uniref:Uncharacterized protein n=1 Tax=Hyalomma asiaticum TaxID=266040 RepID=A0ACB7SWL5_HYAAI|nr:hypothetical protein HPB50_017399 [Hyalomma asiaticum]
MPTNTELAKKIEHLESLLHAKLDNLVDDLVSKISKKLEDQGLGSLSELAESIRFISDQYDSVRASVAELVQSNKALRAENDELTKKIADMEQYSRLNNIEIKAGTNAPAENADASVPRSAASVVSTVSQERRKRRDHAVAEYVPHACPHCHFGAIAAAKGPR